MYFLSFGGFLAGRFIGNTELWWRWSGGGWALGSGAVAAGSRLCSGTVAVFSCWAQAVSFTAYLNDDDAAADDDYSAVDCCWWWRGSAGAAAAALVAAAAWVENGLVQPNLGLY